MGRDHNNSERGHSPGRQEHESREHDHCPTQRPKDEEPEEVIVKVELPSQATRHEYFQEYQPEAASEQESRQFGGRLSAPRQKGPGAGKQEEGRRAEVSNPAREE